LIVGLTVIGTVVILGVIGAMAGLAAKPKAAPPVIVIQSPSPVPSPSPVTLPEPDPVVADPMDEAILKLHETVYVQQFCNMVDRSGIDSYATFGRAFDLFGDGSIRLAYTPGHSAGHISVIAHLGERDFVIGGDATYTAAQLDGSAPLAPRPFDEHNYRRSLQELKLFKREYPAAIVTPGHDAEFYAGLSARYE